MGFGEGVFDGISAEKIMLGVLLLIAIAALLAIIANSTGTTVSSASHSVSAISGGLNKLA